MHTGPRIAGHADRDGSGRHAQVQTAELPFSLLIALAATTSKVTLRTVAQSAIPTLALLLLPEIWRLRGSRGRIICQLEVSVRYLPLAKECHSLKAFPAAVNDHTVSRNARICASYSRFNFP